MTLLDFYRPYLINAAKVASWDPVAETWGTPVAVPNLQSFTKKPVTDNDLMKIYGVNEHALSVLAGEELEVEIGGLSSASDAIMTGRQATSSGSGDSETRKRRNQGGGNLPYFGWALQILTDGGGDIHLFYPRLKLRSLFPIEMAKDSKFVVPKVTIDVLRLRLEDGTLYPISDEVEHKVATSLTSDFNTAFLSL